MSGQGVALNPQKRGFAFGSEMGAVGAAVVQDGFEGITALVWMGVWLGVV